MGAAALAPPSATARITSAAASGTRAARRAPSGRFPLRAVSLELQQDRTGSEQSRARRHEPALRWTGRFSVLSRALPRPAPTGGRPGQRRCRAALPWTHTCARYGAQAVVRRGARRARAGRARAGRVREQREQRPPERAGLRQQRVAQDGVGAARAGLHHHRRQRLCGRRGRQRARAAGSAAAPAQHAQQRRRPADMLRQPASTPLGHLASSQGTPRAYDLLHAGASRITSSRCPAHAGRQLPRERRRRCARGQHVHAASLSLLPGMPATASMHACVPPWLPAAPRTAPAAPGRRSWRRARRRCPRRCSACAGRPPRRRRRAAAAAPRAPRPCARPPAPTGA